MALAAAARPTGTRRARRPDRTSRRPTLARPHATLARAARDGGRATSPAASRRHGRTPRRARSGSSHGKGSHVWDVDGNEYVDLHNGFGAMVVGHAHPAIVAAVSERVGRRHPLRPARAGPHPRRRRAGPPLRPAAVALRQLRHRSHDGRRSPDAGRHRPAPDHQGRGQLPRSPRRGAGLGVPGAGRRRARRPAATGARALGGVAPSSPPSPTSCRSAGSTPCAGSCSTIPGEIAGMIIEPVMMNIGVVPPPPGYLDALADLLHAPRRAADVRRGEDRADDRAGRRHRALRGHARHRVPGQGARRRRARAARSAAPRRSWRSIADGTYEQVGHVQRQPADDGRGQGACCSRSSPPPPTATSTSSATSSSTGVQPHRSAATGSPAT